MSKPTDIVETPKKLQSTKELYREVHNLLQRTKLKCHGVFYKILVEPLDPKSTEYKKYTIDSRTLSKKTKPKRPRSHRDHPLQKRLDRIQEIQDNYVQLLRNAKAVLAQLKREHDEKFFKITLHKRREIRLSEVHPEDDIQILPDTDSEWELGPEPDTENPPSNNKENKRMTGQLERLLGKRKSGTSSGLGKEDASQKRAMTE